MIFVGDMYSNTSVAGLFHLVISMVDDQNLTVLSASQHEIKILNINTYYNRDRDFYKNKHWTLILSRPVIVR